MEAVRGGFVALGANLTGFYKDASGAGLILRAPGSWYRAFERQRLSTWSGNAWQFLQERSWENQAP
ncbi:MAG TPA: hypothetical protein VFR99_06470 [Marmoricola sp.]|nr:hypothetical protein [Marmoricola sp.]